MLTTAYLLLLFADSNLQTVRGAIGSPCTHFLPHCSTYRSHSTKLWSPGEDVSGRFPKWRAGRTAEPNPPRRVSSRQPRRTCEPEKPSGRASGIPPCSNSPLRTEATLSRLRLMRNCARRCAGGPLNGLSRTLRRHRRGPPGVFPRAVLQPRALGAAKLSEHGDTPGGPEWRFFSPTCRRSRGRAWRR